MIFTKILKNTIQIKNEKYWSNSMSADMPSNEKLNPIVTKLFIREGKLNSSHVFITLSYFCGSKNIRLNSTHHFIMKIPNKRASTNCI